MFKRIFIDNYRCFTNFELLPGRVSLLLGHEGVDEGQGPPGDTNTPWKRVFEREHGSDERSALRAAVAAWVEGEAGSAELPSLADGRSEIEGIDGAHPG